MLTVVAVRRDDERRRDENAVRRPYLIIDGYNLLHAAGLARRRYGPGQLERCRAQLLAWLSKHLAGSERERTTVVFDAAEAPPGLPRHLTAAGITIRFAAPGKDADDTIEELVAAHSAPRQIRLVSSDHRLQRCVQKRRGTFLDSEDFVQELERRGVLSPESSEPPPPPPRGKKSREKPDPATDEKTREKLREKASEIETELWLRIFGEIPQAEEFSEDLGPAATFTQADVARLQQEIDRQESESRRRKS
jgi:uncharacterized protein